MILRRRMKWLWVTGALVVLAAVVIAAFRPTPLNVEVDMVERRTLTITVEEQGRTRARDPYVVAAPVAGRLLRISLDEGDRVSHGQVVARIALPPENRRSEAIYRADLNAAQARRTAVEASIEEAETSLARARREEQRREELFKNNLISAEEREYYRQLTDVARARLASLQASLDAAEAEVESARSRLMGVARDGETLEETVTAPTDGTVYRVYEESERVVQAGTRLLELSNDDDLELVIDLLTQDAVRVEAGDPILITGWGGDEVINGVVNYVEPEAFTKVSALGVEEQRVNVIADLIDPPASLGAGYRIEAAVVTWEENNVLTIPTSAIFQRGGSWRTFVVSEGEARLRDLEIGRRGREFAQVLGGVEEGERVILFPSDLIASGVEVSF